MSIFQVDGRVQARSDKEGEKKYLKAAVHDESQVETEAVGEMKRRSRIYDENKVVIKIDKLIVLVQLLVVLYLIMTVIVLLGV
jgi:hypothetical protein